MAYLFRLVGLLKVRRKLLAEIVSASHHHVSIQFATAPSVYEKAHGATPLMAGQNPSDGAAKRSKGMVSGLALPHSQTLQLTHLNNYCESSHNCFDAVKLTEVHNSHKP